MEQVRQMIKEEFIYTRYMPDDLFAAYVGMTGPIDYELMKTLRLYYIDLDLLKNHLRQYFLCISQNNLVIVRRKRGSCVDVNLTKMYNNTKNKLRVKRSLGTMGYECVYRTDYGFFELNDINSDIDKVIKKFDEDDNMLAEKYKDWKE